MAGVMYLGNQIVSPVIVQGEEKAFNVDGYDWLGEINAQGELVAPTKDINLVFNGVKDLSARILSSKFSSNSRVKSVSFPDLETVSGDYACSGAFSGTNINSISFPKLETITAIGAFSGAFRDTNLTSVSFPKLKNLTTNNTFKMTFRGLKSIESISFPELQTISGDDSFYGCFNLCDNIKTVCFPKLKRIDGNGIFYAIFSYCQGLKTFSLPSLEYVGGDVGGIPTNYCVSNCENLEVIDLHNLIEIGPDGFTCFAQNTTSLKTLDLSSLTIIHKIGMQGAFGGSGLETVSFPSLTTISKYESFYYCFTNCLNLKTLYFPVLENIIDDGDPSYGGDDPFLGLLSNCDGVVVHFPASLESVIENYGSVLAGFSGTNTTILYDL